MVYGDIRSIFEREVGEGSGEVIHCNICFEDMIVSHVYVEVGER